MDNLSPQLTAKKYLSTISIIHIALLAGIVLFGIVAITVTHNGKLDMHNTNDPFIYIVPIAAIGSFVLSNFIFKQQLAIAVNKDTLNGKLTTYQTALIMRFAPLDGAALLGIVIYLNSGNLLFLIISGLVALYFITIRPTKEKIENDLNFSYQEKMGFDSNGNIGV